MFSGFLKIEKQNNDWMGKESSNSSPEDDHSGTLLHSSNLSPPFVRAPAEDRSKYEKLTFSLDDISSDDSQNSQRSTGKLMLSLILK